MKHPFLLVKLDPKNPGVAQMCYLGGREFPFQCFTGEIYPPNSYHLENTDLKIIGVNSKLEAELLLAHLLKTNPGSEWVLFSSVSYGCSQVIQTKDKILSFSEKGMLP